MATIRAEKIEEMVNGALDGIAAHAEEASASEVFSALLTVGYRAILSAKSLGYVELVRPVIEQFYAQLPPLPPETLQ
jgi:hypothetical protein